MAGVREQFKDIISEVLALVNTPVPPTPDPEFPFPRLIATGTGGSIEISKKIDDLITNVSVDLKKENPARAVAHTDDEWRSSVRRAFGPALDAIDMAENIDSQTDAVLKDVREALQKQDARATSCEYSFGLTLFPGDDIGAFEIGQVRFEPRVGWLEHKAAEGQVTSTTMRRVKKVWEGTTLTKRKPSTDSEREHDIISAIGHCPWVVSVKTSGLANDAGRQRALTAARLATATISLFWARPSAVLDGVNLLVDRTIRREKVLTFIPGKIVLAGSRMIGRPNGPFIKNADWLKSLADYDLVLRSAAEIISFYLEPMGNVPRPKLMNALAQALLWFHEGCRDSVTLMAIVKFTATLDSLAKGDKSGGITRMITARLGPKPDDIMWADGTTLKDGIKEIYGEGRSRTMHGTNDKLGHDWSSTLTRAEGLARLCLVMCLEWASNNPHVDDPAQLQK